jgi:hypothetical protein
MTTLCEKSVIDTCPSTPTIINNLCVEVGCDLISCVTKTTSYTQTPTGCIARVVYTNEAGSVLLGVKEVSCPPKVMVVGNLKVELPQQPVDYTIASTQWCIGGKPAIRTDIYAVGQSIVEWKRVDGVVFIPTALEFSEAKVGKCPAVIVNGAKSIASGAYAATLGADGVTFDSASIAPALLTSITVIARRSNPDTALTSAASKVSITTPNGTYILLDGESISWAAEDNNSLSNVVVTCVGAAAASVIFAGRGA